MLLFQKAINNDFSDIKYEEILEVFPLLYYTVENVEEFILNLPLNDFQACKIISLCNIFEDYSTKVPFHPIFADIAKYQQSKKCPNFNSLGDMKFQFICNEFDSSLNPEKKFRIVLYEISELLDLVENVRPYDFEFSKSELLNNLTFHSEIKLVIYVLIHDFPSLWDFSRIVKGFLHCEKGLELIRSLTLNFPHKWYTICTSLIEAGNKIQGLNYHVQLPEFILHIIKSILNFNPKQIYSILEHCISNRLLPELVLNIAIDMDNLGQLCLLDFLKRILLDEGTETSQWFTQYLKAIRIGSPLTSVVNEKLIEMARSFNSVTEDGSSKEMLIKAQLLLKMLATMKIFTNYQFCPELSTLLVELITKSLPITKISVDFIQFSIAFVIAMRSNFYFDDQHTCNVDSVLTKWLRDLIVKQDEFNKQLQNSYSELLLLFALFYHTKQLNEISKIITSIFGFKVQDIQQSINMFRKVFTHDVFTEQILTSHAVKVPVTKNLSSAIVGHLPIDCVLQLLNLRSFSKNKVKIHNWIYRQICNSVAPIHPKLPQLIFTYVGSLLPSDFKNSQGNDPIPEETIIKMFDTDILGHPMRACYKMVPDIQINSNLSSTDITAQLLILYYLLTFYDMHCNQLVDENFKKYTQFFYSRSIWNHIPIKYLLFHIEKNLTNYLDLYPALLRLLTSHFPQLVCGDFAIQDNLAIGSSLVYDNVCSELPGLEKLNDEFQKYIESNGCDCLAIVNYAQKLADSGSEKLIPYAHIIVDHIHQLLTILDSQDVTVHYRLLNAYKTVWIKLRMIMPRKIENLTINKLQQSNVIETDFLAAIKAIQKNNYTEEQILENPIEILLVNVDQNIFRCAPILDILLRIIESIVLSSRAYWYNMQIHSEYYHQSISSKKFESAFGYQDNKKRSELEMLRKSLFLNQEATIIQMLLEKCMPSENEVEDCKKSALTEVQKIICNFIHSMFISEQELCHIVHLQTYPQRLLPITVQGIPSIHISLNYVEKMFLNSGDYYKMVFLLDLVSYIGLFYNIKNSQEIAAKLLEYFQSVVHSLANIEERPMLIWVSIDAIVRMGKTFPNLLTTVVVYMLTVSSLCYSFIGINDDCFPAFGNNQIDPIIEKNFEYLEIEEQYYCCYIKLNDAYDTLTRQGLVQSTLYHSKI